MCPPCVRVCAEAGASSNAKRVARDEDAEGSSEPASQDQLAAMVFDLDSDDMEGIATDCGLLEENADAG